MVYIPVILLGFGINNRTMSWDTDYTLCVPKKQKTGIQCSGIMAMLCSPVWSICQISLFCMPEKTYIYIYRYSGEQFLYIEIEIYICHWCSYCKNIEPQRVSPENSKVHQGAIKPTEQCGIGNGRKGHSVYSRTTRWWYYVVSEPSILGAWPKLAVLMQHAIRTPSVWASPRCERLSDDASFYY